jgi:hypothetical protein
VRTHKGKTVSLDDVINQFVVFDSDGWHWVNAIARIEVPMKSSTKKTALVGTDMSVRFSPK